VTHKALSVKWEPTSGNLYAILFEKRLDVFKAEASEPVSSVSSDLTFSCFDFVSPTEIITADVQGKLTFVKHIEDESKTTITLITTKVNRFRDIRCLPGSETLVTASSSEGKLCFYSVEALRKFHLEVGTAKPTKSIKSKCRFLCIAINHMKAEQKR